MSKVFVDYQRHHVELRSLTGKLVKVIGFEHYDEPGSSYYMMRDYKRDNDVDKLTFKVGDGEVRIFSEDTLVKTMPFTPETRDEVLFAAGYEKARLENEVLEDAEFEIGCFDNGNIIGTDAAKCLGLHLTVDWSGNS